jgi:hypothetical protein
MNSGPKSGGIIWSKQLGFVGESYQKAEDGRAEIQHSGRKQNFKNKKK